MSGGGGTQTSTQQTSQNLPAWEVPYGKDYLGSLMSYVFPTAQAPANTSAAAAMLNQIDPSGTAYSMFAPMISGSPYLQQMAAQNPAAVVGAISPMAAAQMSNQNLYGGGSTGGNAYGLNWIPGLGGQSSAAGAAQGAATAPAASSGNTAASSGMTGIFSPSYATTAAAPPAPAAAAPAPAATTTTPAQTGGSIYSPQNNPLAGTILSGWFTQQTPEMQQQIIANYANPTTQTGRGTAR
jgi:hypothetical protein